MHTSDGDQWDLAHEEIMAVMTHKTCLINLYLSLSLEINSKPIRGCAKMTEWSRQLSLSLTPRSTKQGSHKQHQRSGPAR